MSKYLLLSLLIPLFSSVALAQRPLICGPSANMELQCVDACIICDIDGFEGRNDTQGAGDKPPSFCTSINHNIQWIGFLAGSERLTIELDVFNCDAGTRPDGGLEAGVFEVTDCDVENAVAVSNCDSDIPNNSTQELRMTTLVPGNYYYFVVDGNNGDVCNYRVRVTEGTTRVPEVPHSGGLRGPTRVCEDLPFVFETSRVPAAPYYEWTLNGDTLSGLNELSRTLTFDTAGIYNLCVTASNICNAGPPECLEIRVGDFAPTLVPVQSCANEPVVLEGQTISATGQYTYILENSVGCDSTVTYDVLIIPTVTTRFDTTICAGDVINFNGTNYGTSGSYTANYTSRAGCDSTSILGLSVQSCGYQAGAVPSMVSCHGRSDGSLAVWVSGPAPPYLVDYVMVGNPAFSGTLTLSGDSTGTLLDSLAAGTYRFEVLDSFGVQQIFTSRITQPALMQTTLTPLDREGWNLSCANGNDGLITAHARGGTPPYAYRWSSGETTATIDNLQAGRYIVNVIDAQGCTSEAEAELDEPPAVELTNLDTLICSDASIRFNGELLSTPGTYSALYQSVRGCDSTVVLRLTTEPCGYRAGVVAVPVSCKGDTDGRLHFWASGLTGPYLVEWALNGDIGGGPIVVQGDSSLHPATALPPGDYRVTFIDQRGEAKAFNTEITEPRQLLVAAAASPRGAYEISCAGSRDGSIELNPSGGTSPYNYRWNDGAQGKTRYSLLAGDYSAVVTDAAGCETEVDITLNEPAPLTAALEAQDRGCDPDDHGGVLISALAGGQGNYRVRINHGAPQAIRPFTRLEPGTHDVHIQDAEGCSFGESVTVTAPEVPTVDLGGNMFIDLGEELILEPVLSGTGLSYRWTSDADLSCTDCRNPRTAPLIESTYTLEGINQDGCPAEANLQIYVRTTRELYAPTAISPNGDGLNDGFTIYSSDNSLITELRIFDRWGSEIYTRFNIPTGQTDVGWQGDVRGEPAKPGVFVYYARITSPEGEEEVLKGDITVMR